MTRGRFHLLAFAGVSLACGLLALSSSRAEPEETLPAFRRQLLPPERLAEELKRVRDGVLVRLPVKEFDARVERAARAAAPRVPPRLLEARYHATLRGEGLVGDGQWKLVHKGPAPGLLKLEPFNLALRQARFENHDALVAAFDDRTPALLVEAEGEQTVSLEWSARAEARPEGLQFRLEMPGCPVALLELDVPAGRAVSLLGARDEALLSGPHPAESPALRRWNIVCGGRGALDFRIRPADPPAAGARPPTLLVRQKTTQKVSPEGLDSVFELTLEGAARGVRELVCECDPELRLRDVAGPNVEGCSFQAGSGGAPSRLTIRLREPVREGTWQVFCLAPLGAAPAGPARTIAWKCPGLRLVGGVPRGETLELHFHPDLRIETWEPGGFRVTGSAGTDPERPAGGQHLVLAGGGVGPEGAPAGAPPRRPEARLQVYGAEFRAREVSWWRCDGAGMALTVQVGYEVSQGRLFRLPVRLPADWVVERVELSPASLLRGWRVRGGVLHVDLVRPLVSAEEAKREAKLRPTPLVPRVPTLTVHLRPAWRGPVTGRTLPFPDAEPLGARFREGVLALDCDERLFHLDVKTTADRSEPDSEGPWGQQPPEYSYRFRGPVPSGSLLVRPRPPRLRARCTSEVFVASGRAAVQTHLLLEAEVGSPDTLELSLSESDGGTWQWQSEAGGNGVRRAERLVAREAADDLRVLAAGNALQAVSLFAARPAGERWRLTLARPLRAREPLRLHATRQLQPRDGRWRVPLPVVLGAGRMEGEVTLHLAGADLVQVQSVGLREAAPEGAGAWRTFRYGQTDVALTLGGQALAAGRAPRAVFDRARLVVHVAPGGLLRHHFSFQVTNWDQRTLPLGLPPGSTPLAVQVDGHWLPWLVPSTARQGEADDGEELALPVPGGEASGGESIHRFAVVYTRPAGAALPWQSVAAPSPVLPAEPLTFRRSWRLSPGLVPLRQARYQAVAGTDGDGVWADLPRQAADLFRLPGDWPRLEPLWTDERAGAREALARAAESIRARRGGQTVPLGELVSDLAFVQLKGRHPLVVDALALREAGVLRETPVAVKPLATDGQAPPWAECGLVAVPARGAVLLTTASGRGATLREPLSESVEQAMAAAVARGQDASGRFRSPLSWLGPCGAVAAVSDPRLLGAGPGEDGWGEWEPVAGLGDEEMVVVRRDVVAAAGMAVAVLMGLFFWLIRRRSPRWRLAWLLLALAVGGPAVFGLPSALRALAWWPFAAGCLGAALWYLVRLARPAPEARASVRKARSAVAPAVLLLLGVLGWGGRAAAPAPVIVYLVPGPPEAPENQTVLVPADLLNRLRERERPRALVPGGPQAVLLDASYDGRLVEGQAEFAVVFSVQCLTEGPATLALPLGGVRLVGNVWVDGARAEPLALPPPQAGYSLAVRGVGRHKVELRFRAPVTGTAEDRNVLFAVPPVVRSRLTWHVPPGASYTQALVKHGAQWTTGSGGDERLEADLGRLPAPLHLHWHQAAPPARPARVQCRAAYLWDLRLEEARLTAWLRYQVRQGAIKTLEVDLPAGLEVLSAIARRIPGPEPAPAWLSRFELRDWQVVPGAARTLRLELPYPISGDFQVTVELVPGGPLPATVSLPLPSPRGERSTDPHYLAYRTHPGLSARLAGSQNVTRIADAGFAPDWPGVPRLPTPATRAGPDEAAAYTFHPDRAPALRLHLHRSPPAVLADLDVTVQAGPHLADVQVAARLQAPDKDLAVVEWDVPKLTIAAVTGEDVRSWTQSGSRLLVWLNRTTAATRLTLSGWLPLDRARLDLSGPRLVQPRRQHTRLRLLAAADLALAGVRADNMKPAADPAAADREQVFEATEASYHVAGEVQAARAVARVLTFAEVIDRRLQLSAVVNYEIRNGEMGHVRLRLRNWEPDKVKWEAERVAQYREPRRTPGDRSLVLDLQPGVTGRYQVVLRGSLPVEEAAAGVPLPDVQVMGVERAEYSLAIAGGELAAEERGALARLAHPARDLSAWPGVAERVERTGGRGWRVQGSEWQLRLLPRARAAEPTMVRVYLLEQSAAVADGRRWLHEARLWLRHEAHADLTVDFPAPAHVVVASVDGAEVTPLQPGSSRLWLPLPGRAGVRCVRLRWQYDPSEPLDRPNLAPPELADARKGPALWTVLAPAGWESVRSTTATRLGSGAAREAALALYRADAQLRIVRDLCKLGPDGSAAAPLAAAQRRFALDCLHARRALESGGEHGGVTAPDGRTTLSAWLAELLAENRRLAGEHGFEPVRADAEKRTEAGETAPVPNTESRTPEEMSSPIGESGTPISWHAGPGEKSPELQLASRAGRRTRQALASSGQWLGVLVVVWVLSFLPFLPARLRLFWPEQLALLGAVGWHLAGPTLVVLLLLLVAAAGRLFLLARGLRALLRRTRNQPSTMTAASAGSAVGGSAEH